METSTTEENTISRLFAAVIAVAAVEFALFFALYAISGRRQVYQAMLGAPGWFHLLVVIAACAGGWVGGLQGLNWLYQHMSYRHASDQRSPVLTGALWCLLLLVAAAARTLAE
jgi:hypothetical protein